MRRYLAALECSRKGGRRRVSEAITNRILKLDELLVSADPLTRLHLTQERIDLHGELIRYAAGTEDDISALEKQFIKVARPYSDRGGINYAAWRQVGVDPEVLERAGIMRAPQVRNGLAPGVAAPGSPAEAAAADPGDGTNVADAAVEQPELTPAGDDEASPPDDPAPGPRMRRKRSS